MCERTVYKKLDIILFETLIPNCSVHPGGSTGWCGYDPRSIKSKRAWDDEKDSMFPCSWWSKDFMRTTLEKVCFDVIISLQLGVHSVWRIKKISGFLLYPSLLVEHAWNFSHRWTHCQGDYRGVTSIFQESGKLLRIVSSCQKLFFSFPLRNIELFRFAAAYTRAVHFVLSVAEEKTWEHGKQKASRNYWQALDSLCWLVYYLTPPLSRLFSLVGCGVNSVRIQFPKRPGFLTAQRPEYDVIGI